MGVGRTISVVIPARNAAATLPRALASVEAQSVLPDEVIVVDDHSSDSTAAEARQWGARVIALPQRQGAAAARNHGIAAASGVWVAFLDADDEWLPAKLALQLDRAEQRPDAGLIYSRALDIMPDGAACDMFHDRPAVEGAEAWKALLVCNVVSTPAVLIRRGLLEQLGGFDCRLVVAEDQDLWIRAAEAAPIACVHEHLVRAHIRAGSLSHWRLSDQFAYTLPMIERHLLRYADRLSPGEIRTVRGERLSRTGMHAYDHGDFGAGLRLVLEAAILGHKPLRYLALAAKLPVARAVKRALAMIPET